MRLVKLVVCGVAFAALAFVPAALAAEEPAAAATATAPSETPDDAPAAAADPVAAEVQPGTEAAPAAVAPMADAAEAAPGTPDSAVPAADAASEPAAATESPVANLAPSDTPETPAEAQPGASAASEPTESAAESPDDAAVAEAPAAPTRPVLGAIGYDSEGRQGRIHIVVPGDTLWDISDAYLGTPWVWPSIWTDNRNIENPHLIHPGDHIWITDSEMRVVSPAEAEAMLAGRPAAPEEFPAAEPAPMEPPVEVAAVPDAPQTRRVSIRDWVGLLSADRLEGAASIVKRVPSHVLLAQIDEVYISLGEGDVEVGDQFDVIRDEEKVFDPQTRRFLGYYVEVLGWLEVKEVYEETALARIRLSTADIGVGDKLIRRQPESLDIAVRPGPEDVEGAIAFFPSRRVVIGQLDIVYLNRGTLDGLEAGSPLEVVRGGEVTKESLHGRKVRLPQRVVAQLLVLEAEPETAVALVDHAETELEVGDSFRGAAR